QSHARAVLGLLRPYRQHAVADVLMTDAHGIFAAQRGVQPDGKRQARLRADGMVRLELCDLGVTPSMESVRLRKLHFDVKGWVMLDKLARLGPADEMAERGCSSVRARHAAIPFASRGNGSPWRGRRSVRLITSR